MKIGLSDWLFSQIDSEGRFRLMGILTIVMLAELLLFMCGWLALGINLDEFSAAKLFAIYPAVFVYLRASYFFGRNYWLRYGLLIFLAEFILFTSLWEDIPLDLRLSLNNEQTWALSFGILFSMHRRFLFFWYWCFPTVLAAVAAGWAEWQTEQRAKAPEKALDILDDVEPDN